MAACISSAYAQEILAKELERQFASTAASIYWGRPKQEKAMFKDKNGVEFMSGDHCVFAMPDGKRVEKRVSHIDGRVWVTDYSWMADPAAHEILRRADGSSPAPTPTEGERPVLGKDRDGRDVRKGDVLRCSCEDGDHCEMGLERREHDRFVVAAFSGKYFTSTDDSDGPWYLVPKLAILVTDSPATEPAPPPSAPPPLVGAEELAGWQRERFVEEHKRLERQYEAFLDAGKKAVAGTRVKFVADKVTADLTGRRFMAELSIGDLTRTLFFSSDMAFDQERHLFREALVWFQEELGSRLLKGGGK